MYESSIDYEELKEDELFHVGERLRELESLPNPNPSTLRKLRSQRDGLLGYLNARMIAEARNS